MARPGTAPCHVSRHRREAQDRGASAIRDPAPDRDMVIVKGYDG
ncbi:MAG: hypothetical protein ACK5MY_04255 [Jhaorihella sp.]